MEAELTELNKFVKETDPSRMTVGASNQAGRRKLNNIPDHIAFNTVSRLVRRRARTMKQPERLHPRLWRQDGHCRQ